MSTAVPPCRTVTVHAFGGDRSAFGQRVRRALDDEKHGRGLGPSTVDCLLYAGHAGVSTDRDRAIYGFNPDIGGLPLGQAMERLRNGEAFAGVVSDDTHVFIAAARQGLNVLSFDVILPGASFQTFRRKLSAERRASRYSYGFPDGDGDCNCTTWLERLGLPLLTGSMDEFTDLLGINLYPRRRFGYCV
jgi:hypothetical protein